MVQFLTNLSIFGAVFEMASKYYTGVWMVGHSLQPFEYQTLKIQFFEVFDIWMSGIQMFTVHFY